MNGLGTSPEDVRAAIAILRGPPELVVVDERVLRLLMGRLADLIILRDVGDPIRFARDPDQLPLLMGGDDDGPYVWDDDDPCFREA